MQPLRHLSGSSFIALPVNATSDGRVPSQLVCVAEETPVAVRYSGFAHAVMMATPDDLEDFTAGFSLSEGVTQISGPLPDISIRRDNEGTTVDLTLGGEDLHRYLAGRRVRQLRGYTSRGLCGVKDLNDVARPVARVRPAALLDVHMIRSALTALRQSQRLSRQTRGAHASAWASPEGHLQTVREDAGRHNSLDKLIGALLRNRGASDCFCVIASRCSFEVQKAIAAGFPTLVTGGAPTAHAIRLSEGAGLTLLSVSGDGKLLLVTSPAFAETDVCPELAS
jgi:formate dehydrogenase accessory protein FdhD